MDALALEISSTQFVEWKQAVQARIPTPVNIEANELRMNQVQARLDELLVGNNVDSCPGMVCQNRSPHSGTMAQLFFAPNTAAV
jgi:hypothetical protein